MAANSRPPGHISRLLGAIGLSFVHYCILLKKTDFCINILLLTPSLIILRGADIK